MLRVLCLFLAVSINVMPAWATAPADSESELIEAFERGDTVLGWVHASMPRHNQYVFTWRNPQNFFDAFEYPMIPTSSDLQEMFPSLQRHDHIAITGRLVQTASGQRHIFVESLDIREHYEPDLEFPPPPSPDYMQELQESEEAIFSVHALLREGRVLIVDYKDQIFPVVVTDTTQTKLLWRYDKIRMRYQFRFHPSRPPHLELARPEADRPSIEVLRRVTDEHNEAVELSGDLTLYSKSPQITFDIFALRHVDTDGIKTIHTLVNFEDPELFASLRNKLKEAWDHSEIAAINDRNKLVKPGLTVTARGIKNIASPNQANPQILINSLDQISIKTP